MATTPTDHSKRGGVQYDEHGRSSLSGLTHDEAREFHSYFTKSFLGFLAIAILAHIATYIAMPWGLPA